MNLYMNRILPDARIRHFDNNSKEQSNRMSVHMINRSRVMLSRCHSHRMCFGVDAGSGTGKNARGWELNLF